MRHVWRPALLLLGLVGVGLLVRLLPGGGGAGAWLQGFIERQDRASAFVFVLAGAVVCAGGVPRQVVAYSAGFVFGALPGIVLALAAQLLGCAADFLWARLVGREWARGFMARRLGGRMARMDRFLSANPFAATLMLRLVPVGNNLVLNLLAGVSGVALLPFIAASAIGYLPQTAVFALIGAGLRVDQSVQVSLGVALFGASAVAGVVLLRRLRAGALAEG